MPWIQDLQLPDDVREGLRKTVEGLVAAGGENLVSVVLYAGVLRGRYQPESSDINLAIVLKDASAAALEALAAPLQAGWRAWRVEPYFLVQADLTRVGDLFPIRIADILRSRLVLHGADAFDGIIINPDRLRLRIQQVLHNHSIRLRRDAVLLSASADIAWRVAEMLGSLSAIMAALLEMRGHREVPTRFFRLAEIAIRELGVPESEMNQLVALRSNPGEVADSRAVLRAAMIVVARLEQVVSGTTGGGA